MITPRSYPNPNSRFQIIPSPLLSPGKCMVCGTPNRPVVDFNLELNVNGYAFRVYVCILCMQDADSQVTGYLESIGEVKSGADTLASYLTTNNLKVISDEHYDNLVFWASGLGGLVDSVVSDPLNSSKDAEGELGDDPEGDIDAESDDSVDDDDLRSDDKASAAFSL